MLSMQDDPVYVRRAFAAGANGYLLKDAADAELVKAVHEVSQGHRYLHPVLGARLAATEPSARSGTAEPQLTEREHAVLRLLALGHTNQEIAKLLFISIRTVESHRAKIGRSSGAGAARRSSATRSPPASSTSSTSSPPDFQKRPVPSRGRRKAVS